ncbi:MAG: MATE family efflux transporter [Myxococcales bacterium]|nr:MATE family efflux transporter [Myxococcales bacterium]
MLRTTRQRILSLRAPRGAPPPPPNPALEGAGVPDLLRLAWPMAVSMLSYSLMTFVDTLFVSALGPAALAGVGLAGVAAFTFLTFGIGFARGVKVATAQALGAGRSPLAYLGGGLVIALGLGGLVAGLSPWLSDLVSSLASSAESGVQAHDYLAIRLAGAAFALVFSVLREYRYGLGDSRLPMVAALAANAVNIALDYTFIVVLKWGVAGAAWATIAAQVIEVVVVGAFQVREGLGFRDLRLAHVRVLARLGVPSGAEFTVQVSSFALMTVLIAGMGDAQMAAHQIMIQTIHFAFLPIVAIAEAGSVLVSNVVGAGRDDAVGRVTRSTLLVTGVYALGAMILLPFLGGPLAFAFSATGPVAETLMAMLWVAAAFQLPDAGYTVVRAVLRGTGDVKVPAWLGILIAWCILPTTTWGLGYFLGWGAVAGWIAILLEVSMGLVILGERFRRGSWRPLAEASRADIRAADATAIA